MSELNMEKRGRDFIGLFFGHVLSISRATNEFIARIDGEVIAEGKLSYCYQRMHERVFGF